MRKKRGSPIGTPPAHILAVAQEHANDRAHWAGALVDLLDLTDDFEAQFVAKLLTLDAATESQVPRSTM
jgi:hypothetical protein